MTAQPCWHRTQNDMPTCLRCVFEGASCTWPFRVRAAQLLRATELYAVLVAVLRKLG